MLNDSKIIGGGKRIGYIDAMRGFSMILVVLGHMLLMCGYPTVSTALGVIIESIQMPLFFFISGYFAYKGTDAFTPAAMRHLFAKRIKALVICTIVFYSIFQICHSRSPLLVFDQGFDWFWFTIALFQMFVIYYAVNIMGRAIKSGRFVNITLIFIAVAFFVTRVRYHHQIVQLWPPLESFNVLNYFQYFVFGILARKYSNYFLKMISKDAIKTTILLVYVLSLFGGYGFNGALESFNSGIANVVKMIAIYYSGLLTVFIVFNSNSKYFGSESRVSRWMRFVGRRTLDIYMLHVFFLPNLRFMNDLLEGQLLLQLTTGIIGVVLVIAVCLMLSSVIRSSSFLSDWLFGEKAKASLQSSDLVP